MDCLLPSESLPSSLLVASLTNLTHFDDSWDHTATGMLIGLSSYTTRQHIARATLEATCFQTRALIDAMIKDTAGDHAGLEVLKVDGGMTQCDVTMQLQADLLGIQVERPEMKE